MDNSKHRQSDHTDVVKIILLPVADAELDAGLPSSAACDVTHTFQRGWRHVKPAVIQSSRQKTQSSYGSLGLEKTLRESLFQNFCGQKRKLPETAIRFCRRYLAIFFDVACSSDSSISPISCRIFCIPGRHECLRITSDW